MTEPSTAAIDGTSFYSAGELATLGFRALGRNVRISRKASIYGASRIEIGDHVRVDDFAILSGGAGITWAVIAISPPMPRFLPALVSISTSSPESARALWSIRKAMISLAAGWPAR